MPEKTFEEKRDALSLYLTMHPGLEDADTMLKYISDNFTPRDLWPDKIYTEPRADPLKGFDLDLGLG